MCCLSFVVCLFACGCAVCAPCCCSLRVVGCVLFVVVFWCVACCVLFELFVVGCGSSLVL